MTETVYLRRILMTEHSTQGVVTHDGKILCVSIERPWLDNKPNVSCIPACRPYDQGWHYIVRREDSPKFGPGTWHVQGVGVRTHIIFGHVGNWAKDVAGCMAFGMSFAPRIKEGFIASSGEAVSNFKEYTQAWDEFRLVIVDC